MKRPRTLRSRLLRQFLLLGLAPVLGAWGAALLLLAPELATQAEVANRELAQVLRDQVELQLALRQRTATVLVQQLGRGEPTPSQQTAALQALLAEDAFLQAAYIAERSGAVVAAAVRDGSGRHAEDAIGVDLSGQPYFGRAVAGERPVWSDTFLSTLGGEITAVLVATAPARAVVLEFSLAGLSASLQDLAREGDVRVVVLDRRGRVIAHPDPSLAQRQEIFGSAELRRAAMLGERSGRETVDGVENFVHALPVVTTGWTVIAMQPVAEVLAPLRRLGALLFAVLVATVAIAGAASWLYAHRTGREVSRLAEGAHQAARNGGDAPSMSFLTVEFNDVWLRLRELFQQIHVRDRQTQAARADLQAVLDAATQVAIVAADQHGLVTVFNIGAERMLGRSAASQLGQARLTDWHDPDELAARRAALGHQYGREVDDFEAVVVEARHGGYEVRDWTFVRADGHRIDVSLAVTGLRGPDGELRGFLAVAIDITERRHAQALELSRRSAEAANRAKSEFLSKVSHELRTPLNAMLGYAQLVEIDSREPPTEGQRERMRHIQRAGWHLVQLIDDVLELSRLESGQLRVELTTLDLRAALQQALSVVAPQARQAGIAVHAPPPGDALPVRADRTRLVQVLVNLLGNAIKYNRPGGRVDVTLHHDGGRVAVDVADTGIGMTAEQLERLFVPFDRLGRETSGVEGTGIGLVIANHLVERMGGALAVASDAGRGSTFTVRLDAPPQTLAPTLPAEHAATPRPGPAEGDVLHVEDNALNAQLMRAILRQRPGVRLREAATLADALAALRQSPPQLVLVDLHLPDGHGTALVAAMKADAALRDIPVVVVSADATRSQVADVLALGVHAYLTKPVRVPDVLRVVDEALGSQPQGQRDAALSPPLP